MCISGYHVALTIAPSNAHETTRTTTKKEEKNIYKWMECWWKSTSNQWNVSINSCTSFCVCVRASVFRLSLYSLCVYRFFLSSYFLYYFVLLCRCVFYLLLRLAVRATWPQFTQAQLVRWLMPLLHCIDSRSYIADWMPKRSIEEKTTAKALCGVIKPIIYLFLYFSVSFFFLCLSRARNCLLACLLFKSQ